MQMASGAGTVACAAVLWLSGVPAADETRAAQDKKGDDGYVSIFDGKSLKGWHVSAKSGHSSTSKNKSGGNWRIEDGAIVGSQDIPKNGGLVITDKHYGD